MISLCRAHRSLTSSIFAVAMLSGNAFAADVVGSTVLKGKRVELLDDGTWRYSDPKNALPAKCVPINANISFCGSILEWKPSRMEGTDFTAIFSHGSREYGGIIHEAVGLRDGFEPETFRQIILDNLSSAIGVPVEMIPVLRVEETKVDGRDVETMIYGARVSGLNVVYANSWLMTPETTSQFVTWSIAKDYTPEHEKLHAEFLSNLRLTLTDTEETQ